MATSCMLLVWFSIAVPSCLCACVHAAITCLLVIWHNSIEKNNGRVSAQLDLSCLSKISDGYTPGHIITATQGVLNDRRITQVIRET